MVLTDKIERVLHKELEPAVTYIKRGSLVPLELELQALSDWLELNEASNRQIEKLREILLQAEAVAKKRMKREINARD